MTAESIVVGVAGYAFKGGFLVRVEDDRGNAGSAETLDQPEIRSSIGRWANLLIGMPVFATNARWDDRPRADGPEWTGYSVLENALAGLGAAVASMALHEWLGGKANAERPPVASLESVVPEVRVLEAGDREFDGVARFLVDSVVHAVVIDPRHWSVPAIVRLDALCRTLQIGIAFDVRGGGHVALGLAGELAAALPMATLGVIASGAPRASLSLAAPVLRLGQIRG